MQPCFLECLLPTCLPGTEFPCKQIVESILDLPIILPHTAAGLALLLVFGSEGILGKALKPLGIHFMDSLWGMSVAMAFVSFPYLINLSKQAFANIDPETELSAQVDGASHWQSFIHISLPLASRGILSGILMMWSRGISEFGAVVILAYHPRILPVLLFETVPRIWFRCSQTTRSDYDHCSLHYFRTDQIIISGG